MLRPTGFNTLATELWSRTDVEAFGDAAPYALAMILLASVPAWLMGRWLAGTPGTDGQTGTEHDEPVHVQQVTYVGGAR
jgi:hypothetical protein